MITFSFRPISGSTLPLIAASVRTLVVSWKEAADRKEFVARDALVIPVSYTHLDVYKRQLLKIVTFSWDVACYFDSVGKTNSGDFSKS